jgi:hypothetical protein
MPGSVAHDHLDDLLAAMRLHYELMGDAPGLVTADIDSAFRRIPLNVRHRWAAGVAYSHDGIPYVAVTMGCHMEQPAVFSIGTGSAI